MSERFIATTQAGYFVVTGVWPLIHRRSFEAVLGPKSDYWLVQTVGVLVASVGAALAAGAARNRVSQELKLLGTTTALGLAIIDIRHASVSRISRIYLADAALELALIGAWLTAGRSPSLDPRPKPGVSTERE